VSEEGEASGEEGGGGLVEERSGGIGGKGGGGGGVEAEEVRGVEGGGRSVGVQGEEEQPAEALAVEGEGETSSALKGGAILVEEPEGAGGGQEERRGAGGAGQRRERGGREQGEQGRAGATLAGGEAPREGVEHRGEEGPQGEGNGASVGGAQGRVASEEVSEQRVEGRVEALVERGEARGLLGEDLGQKGRGGGPGERVAASDGAEDQAPEGKDVGAGVRGAPGSLLRGQVAGGPRGRIGGEKRARHAEVDEHHAIAVSAGDHQVGGGEIAVEVTQRMERAEGLGGLVQQGEGGLRGEGPFVQDLLEGEPTEPGLDQEGEPALDPVSEAADHARVLDGLQERGFPGEAQGGLGRGEQRELAGDLGAAAPVDGPEDGGGAPLGGALQELVGPADPVPRLHDAG
jgi:hypothetical protein